MIVVKYLLIIAFALTLQTTEKKVILFFGDSLTAGYGLSTEEAFPALAEKHFLDRTRRLRSARLGASARRSALAPRVGVSWRQLASPFRLAAPRYFFIAV